MTHVPGDPARPFGEDDLRRSSFAVTAAVLDRERAEAEFAAALTALERPAAFIREIGRVGGSRLLQPVARQHHAAAIADLVAVLAEAQQHILDVRHGVAAKPHASGRQAALAAR